MNRLEKLPTGAARADEGGTADPRPAPLRCLLCAGLQHRTVFTEVGIDILRCENCGHIFSSYRGDPHYTEYLGDDVPADEHFYWSKARAKMHHDFFDRFVKGKSGRLLDMGSGLGFFVKAMSAYPAWEAYGCEISPAAVRHAQNQLGLRNVVCSRLQDADFPRSSFDMITIWDVIDHIMHPDPLLSRCSTLLKNDGSLFIRTPNITVQLLRARLGQALDRGRTDTKYLQATDHFHHYSAGSIRKLLGRNGFTDVSFIHLHPIGSADSRRAPFVDPIKNACFQGLRALDQCSGGRLNFDNLFVVARKGTAPPSA
jgi:2-polyprenyl-3-methyl-5-hydroxy-6-metoxy-1,4-benzoquinol methylase